MKYTVDTNWTGQHTSHPLTQYCH